MIPRERITRLFSRAREAARTGEEERARQYIRRARTIAQRHRLSLPWEFTRGTCDACDRVLIPGRTARVRTRSGHVVVTCECGEQARYPYE